MVGVRKGEGKLDWFREQRRRLLGIGLLAIPLAVDAWPSPYQGFQVCNPRYVLGGIEEMANSDQEFADRYNGWAYLDSSAKGNRVTLRTSKDSSGSFARMGFSMAPSFTNPYSAEIGLRLGFDRQWSTENDLRSTTAIRFKARASSEQTVAIALLGPATPFGLAGYAPIKNIAVDTVWKWFQIKPSDFKFAQWMKDDAKKGTRVVDLKLIDPMDNRETIVPVPITARAVAARVLGADSAISPYYADDSVNLLKNVKLIQFGIEPTYDAAATTAGTALDADYAPTVQNAYLDLDSIHFVGQNICGIFEQGIGCRGPYFVLEDFSPFKDITAQNYAGQYWYAVSDTSSAPGADTNKAVGNSKIWGDGQDTSDPKSEFRIVGFDGFATMHAILNKGDAKLHPYAGFAELGTRISASQAGKSLIGFKAFQFDIMAGGPEGLFDKNKLQGVTFKVSKASVGDSVAYMANIPYDAIKYDVAGDYVSICVDAAQLKQPAWYSARVGAVPFKANDVKQISWSIKIQKDSDTAATHSIVSIMGVRVYVSENYFPVGVKGISARGTKSLVAEMTAKGLAVSFTVPGDKAQLDIVRLDGAKVASFTTAASVSNLSLPVSLQNGTYMVVVRGEGARQVVTLPVLGR